MKRQDRNRGLFVTFEGIDGSGKSTQLERLCCALDARGIPYRLVREPGGTPLAEAIRRLVLDPSFQSVTPASEVLLYAAARAELVHQVLWPALRQGELVLCDRFLDSSLAYQGYGRGLPLDAIIEANRMATAGLRPDLTILFDLPAEVAANRRMGAADRIEQQSLAFHQRVRDGYRQLAAAEPDRFYCVDATQGADEVERLVQARLSSILQREGWPW